MKSEVVAYVEVGSDEWFTEWAPIPSKKAKLTGNYYFLNQEMMIEVIRYKLFGLIRRKEYLSEMYFSFREFWYKE